MISSSMSSLGVMHDDDWVSKPIQPVESVGRWPANFILISEEAKRNVDDKSKSSSDFFQAI